MPNPPTFKLCNDRASGASAMQKRDEHPHVFDTSLTCWPSAPYTCQKRGRECAAALFVLYFTGIVVLFLLHTKGRRKHMIDNRNVIPWWQ